MARLFSSRSACGWMQVVSIDSCPSHKAMVARSTPLWSGSMAALCRSVGCDPSVLRRRAPLAPAARALVPDRAEGRHHPLARNVLAPAAPAVMRDRGRTVVQRLEGGAHDHRRKPVSGIGDAVLEDLGGSVPGKGFQALVRPRHVRHEPFGKLPRKEMAGFLAQGSKAALGKRGGTVGIHHS